MVTVRPCSRRANWARRKCRRCAQSARKLLKRGKLMITDDALREYADRLEANGFTVYEPKGSKRYFLYSRMVDGQECFGYVQSDWYVGPGGPSGYSHSMPIKPSIENGSSMFVEVVTRGMRGRQKHWIPA